MFQISDVNLYAYAEQLNGSVMQYTATYFRYKSERILETFTYRRRNSPVMQSVGPVTRLVMLQVWAARNCRPGTHFTNDLSIVIQIWQKFLLALIQFLINLSL